MKVKIRAGKSNWNCLLTSVFAAQWIVQVDLKSLFCCVMMQSGSLNPVPVILEPERLPAFSRFGFAVTNAGDLDEDGREGRCSRCDTLVYY